MLTEEQCKRLDPSLGIGLDEFGNQARYALPSYVMGGSSLSEIKSSSLASP